MAKRSPRTCYAQTHFHCLPPSPHPSLLSLSVPPPKFFYWPSILFFKCFVYLKYSKGRSDMRTQGWMDGWIEGWVGGWVEKGRSFFTWPCVGGASLSPPLSVSLPQTGCVCNWAGSSCLSWAFWHSSPSCPPTPCLRLSLALWGFPSLTHSLAWTSSFACLSIHIVLCQHLAIFHKFSVSLKVFVFHQVYNSMELFRRWRVNNIPPNQRILPCYYLLHA